MSVLYCAYVYTAVDRHTAYYEDRNAAIRERIELCGDFWGGELLEPEQVPRTLNIGCVAVAPERYTQPLPGDRSVLVWDRPMVTYATVLDHIHTPEPVDADAWLQEHEPTWWRTIERARRDLL